MMTFKNKFQELYDQIKAQGKIEDKDGIIQIESYHKVSLTPKDATKLDEMYLEMVMKLKKRGILKYCACFKEDGKIILQAV